MAPAKKNAIIFVYDLKIKEAGKGRRVFRELLAKGKFSNMSRDLCRLVCLHSAESYVVDFQNIGVPVDRDSFMDPGFVDTFVENALVSEEPASWLRALLFAAQLMEEMMRSRPKEFVNRHVVFITDLSTPLPDETSYESPGNTLPSDYETQIQEVKYALAKSNSYLYILGPNVTIDNKIIFPNPSYPKSTIPDHDNKKSLMGDSSLQDDPVALGNLKIAKSLLDVHPSLLCNFDVALEMYFFSQCFYPRQHQNDVLTISNLQIPCCVNPNFIRPGPHISFRGGRRFGGVNYVSAQNAEEKILYNNVTSGIKLHGKFVPLTSAVSNNCKVKPGKTFNIICFVPRDQIDEYLLGKDGSDNVYSPNGSEVFQTLVDVLAREDKVAIAERNYRKGLEVKLHVLIPNGDKFSMTKLAFADDIKRKIVVGKSEEDAEEPKVTPTVEETSAIYSFLEERSYESPENKVKLDINLRHVPSNRIKYQKLCNKYLERDLQTDVNSPMDFLDYFDDFQGVIIPKAKVN